MSLTATAVPPPAAVSYTHLDVYKRQALFNLFLDGIVRIWLISVNGGIRVVGKMLKTLMSADDQILLTTNEDDMQRMLHSVNNIVKELNTEISEKKYMAFKKHFLPV